MARCGRVAAINFQGPEAVFRLAANGQIRFALDDFRQPLTHHGMIIHQQDAHFFGATGDILIDRHNGIQAACRGAEHETTVPPFGPRFDN